MSGDWKREIESRASNIRRRHSWPAEWSGPVIHTDRRCTMCQTLSMTVESGDWRCLRCGSASWRWFDEPVPVPECARPLPPLEVRPGYLSTWHFAAGMLVGAFLLATAIAVGLWR